MCRYLKSAVLFVVMGVTIDSHGQTPANDSELQRILSKVRENYATSSAWHFEHKITVEETEGTGPAVKLAEVSLITANRVAPAKSAGVTAAAFCAERCRLESNTAERGTTTLVRDGTTTWFYASTRGEYMKGSTLRDIASSVSGPMLLAVHLMPLENLGAEAWTDVRLLDDGVLQVDGEKRDCFVIEATLKSNGFSVDSFRPGQPPPAPDISMFSTPSGLIQLFQMQGLTNLPSPGAYLAAAGAAPARTRLWIDKERYLVLRRSSTQTATKIGSVAPPQSTPQPLAPVEVSLRIEDVFSRAQIADAVQGSVFTFEPPAGSREIPNVRTRAPQTPAETGR